MTDAIRVRVERGRYDFCHPAEEQAQVIAEIPGLAPVSYLLPVYQFEGLRTASWPDALDEAHQHYVRQCTVTDSGTAAAYAALRTWLAVDENRDALHDAWVRDRTRRDPVARTLAEQVERMRARIEELTRERAESDRCDDSPVCTTEAARAAGLDVAPSPSELASCAETIVWARGGEPVPEVDLARAVPLACAEILRLRALVADATEYRVLLPDLGGQELRASRQAPGFGTGWAVAAPRRGGGVAWTREGWQEAISALSVDRLFCWPDAPTAIREGRTALAADDRAAVERAAVETGHPAHPAPCRIPASPTCTCPVEGQGGGAR